VAVALGVAPDVALALEPADDDGVADGLADGT